MSEDEGSSPNQPLKLPDATRLSLKEFIDTKSPEALEAFLSGIIVEATVVEESITKRHSGPLPTPSNLSAYENILPGLAERIVRLAERPADQVDTEQRHRHKLEDRLTTHSSNYRTTGLWMGYSLAIACLIGAAYCAMHGLSWGVVAFLGVPVAGVISTFVGGAQGLLTRRKSESEEKHTSD